MAGGNLTGLRHLSAIVNSTQNIESVRRNLSKSCWKLFQIDNGGETAGKQGTRDVGVKSRQEDVEEEEERTR